MIYTINSRDCMLYPVMKNALELLDYDVYKEINFQAERMKKCLKDKNVDYDALKLALIPNQYKDRQEICFVFDSTLIDTCDYGNYIFRRLIPLLDKDSTYSIKIGDYINILHTEESEYLLYSAMNEVMEKVHELHFKSSDQYFLVYMNRLTREQIQRILQGLEKDEWFTGFINLTYH